jgi:hypothetical protein
LALAVSGTDVLTLMATLRCESCWHGDDPGADVPGLMVQGEQEVAPPFAQDRPI